MKRTKIVCTIGPASEKRTNIEKMVKAGLNVARLNFSHNTYQHHQMLIDNIRQTSKRLDLSIAILQDLQGPRIRTGNVSEQGIKLVKDMVVLLVPENYKITLKKLGYYIPIQYPDIYKDLKPGDEVLIDDAQVALKVLSISQKTIKCRVIRGGLVKSHKGMNFPDSVIRCSALTDKDKSDVKFGIKNDVDFVALSFVKEGADLLNLRKYIWQIEKRLGKKSKDFHKPTAEGKWGGVHTRIIAKIERKEAVRNFDEILKASDGIMVARGDLGIELPLEDVPLIQKKIIKKCIQAGKPVIVATQMLESMIAKPVPTRAEVSDIANAILDGTDAIMLSGETATGKYPLRAVQVMTRVANEVESTEIREYKKLGLGLKKEPSITEAVSFSVQNIAQNVGAKLIICATTSGFTARSIVRYKPAIKVVAVTPHIKTQRQLGLSWGVEPFSVSFTSSVIELMKRVSKLVLQKKLVKKGDKIVMCSGHPFGYLGQTNLIKVHTV